MSSFFERNKKKSFLAALLLLLRRGRGIVALLIMVFVLSTLFVLPGGMHIPWASRVAERAAFAAPGGRLAAMSAVFKAAREEQPKDGWFPFGARAALWSNNGRSTVEYVRGGVPETPSADLKLHSAKTVSGVSRPEDADRRDNAVNLDMGELVGGLVRSAEAGVMASGGPMGEHGAFSDPGTIAQFSRGSAVPPGSDAVAMALGSTEVPRSDGPVYQGKALPGGKLRNLGSYSISRQISNGGLRSPTAGNNFYILAEARAYSVAAAPPTCPNPGCPKEFAARSAGIVFEGGRADLGVMNAEGFTETGGGMPNQGAISGMINDAQKYAKEAKQCEENERSLGELERQQMKTLNDLSKELNETGCAPESGSCDKEKAKKCQAIAEKMREACKQVNQTFQRKRAACPLSDASAYDQHECDQ